MADQLQYGGGEKRRRAQLVLCDGTRYHGWLFGAARSSSGEIGKKCARAAYSKNYLEYYYYLNSSQMC